MAPDTRSAAERERRRLQAAQRYEHLDVLSEDALTRLTRIVRHALNVPTALITLIGAEHTWLQPTGAAVPSHLPRRASPCAAAVRRRAAYTVTDLSRSERWATLRAHFTPPPRGYAGAPLITSDGHAIGCLNVMDTAPRTFTDAELAVLTDLAQVVMDELELHRTLRTLQAAHDDTRILAFHDALTGLPNRALLLDRAAQALRAARRGPHFTAMMMLDLNKFKLINDSLGHAAGDALLQMSSARLTGALRTGDTIARFGGDEFVALLPELRGPADAASVAQNLIATFDEPFLIDGHLLHVSSSLGISMYPTDGLDPETLLQAADTAMYHAKSTGQGQYAFYTPRMTERAQEKLRLRDQLRRDLSRHALQLHYQPRRHLRTGAITGFEALLRWPQPRGTWIQPGEFLPLAEDSGLIIPLGRWVLREACAQLMRWTHTPNNDWTVSVNVSVRQWTHPEFTDTVRAALEDTHCPPERLTLDVTERTVSDDPDRSVHVSDELARIGVRLAIDDFGTGYSNFSHLQHLRVTELKIHESFIQPLGLPGAGHTMAHAMLALGQQLGAPITAEGIETPQQHAALQQLAFHCGQGHLFGLPLSAEDTERQYLTPKDLP